MSGFWEYPRAGVLVATLTREMTSAKWAKSFRHMQLPPMSEDTMISGVPFDHGRNMACETLLKHQFEWLFFLDDDVCIPPDCVPRLISHGRDVVSGLYYRRAEPVVPVMMRFVDPHHSQSQWITEWPANQLVEADLVGAGCLLIHRRVIERVTHPWFDWQLGKPDPAGPPQPGEPPRPSRLSEDFAFCRKAKYEFGFQIHVDTSVVCEHVGLGKAQVGGSFRPSGV